MGFFMTIPPIRVNFKTACKLLDISRKSLRHIVRTDKSFPKAINTGESEPSPIYFDYAELVAWHNNQKSGLRDDSIKVDLSRDDLRKLTVKDTRHNQSTNTILVYMRSSRNSLLASLHLIVKITSCIIEIVRMCFF